MADRMLGKLAKWLRLMGYDTIYHRAIADDALLSLLASHRDRILLTRHRSLVDRLAPAQYVFVSHDSPKCQLQEVFETLKLKPDRRRFFSRCSRCNEPLESLDRTVVAGHVPEYVLTVQSVFSKCQNCGRIYWPGSHVSRFGNHLEEFLQQTENDCRKPPA